MRHLLGLLFAGCAAASDVEGQAMSVNINPGAGKVAKFTVGDVDTSALTFSSSGNGALSVSHNGRSVITFDSSNVTVTAAAKNLTGTIRADGDLYVVGTLFADDMDVDSENDMAQWSLIYLDLFHETTAGWSLNYTSTCGSPYKILGGHCKTASQELSKTFDKLPEHKQVKVQANYYFIDNWDDDTGWMKIDGAWAWTEEYTWCRQTFLMLCTKGKSICGKEEYPDKIGRMIDAAALHTADAVTVTFGTTFDYADACEASYGVNAVTIWIR